MSLNHSWDAHVSTVTQDLPEPTCRTLIGFGLVAPFRRIVLVYLRRYVSINRPLDIPRGSTRGLSMHESPPQRK